MTISFEVLEAEARNLPPAERARLLGHLIASLDEDAEIEEAWNAEIVKRIESIDCGSARLVPAAEAISQARAALKCL